MRNSLLLLLVVYWILITNMALRVPLFESPDSYFHYAVINHAARTGTLPPHEGAGERPWRQMAFHAPLYYITSAVLTGWVDASDFPESYPINPHARVGLPDGGGNVNFVAHGPASWHGSALAARLVRFYSMLLGLVTLVGIHAIARELFEGQEWTAWLATALVLFNPQFLFISSSITNDALVTTLVTLALLLMLRQMRRGVGIATFLALALLLALASLAKVSGLLLYPAAAAAFLWIAIRDRMPRRRAALYALLAIGLWLGVAGWWYGGNWRTLGDPTARTQVALVTGPRGGAIMDLPGEMWGMYLSFWGLFGWFNLPAPPLFYQWSVAIVAAGGAGVLGLLARRHGAISSVRWAQGGVLLLFTILFAASWASFNRLVYAAQGRLLFPLLGVMAPVAGRGLAALPRSLTAILVGALSVGALVLPVTVIAPAYRPLPADTRPPSSAVPLDFREPGKTDACIHLETPPARHQGSLVEVDLWWHVSCAVEGYWSVFVHLVDIEAEPCLPGVTDYILAQVDSMPQGGRLPFPAMVPGTRYYDRLVVPLPDGLDPTRDWDLYLGLYDAVGRSGTRLPVESDPLSGAIGSGKCAPDVVRYHLPVPADPS